VKKFNNFKSQLLLDHNKAYFKQFTSLFIKKFTFAFSRFNAPLYLQILKSKFIFNEFPNYKTNGNDLNAWLETQKLPHIRTINNEPITRRNRFKNLPNTKYKFWRSAELNRVRFLLDTVAIQTLIFEYFLQLYNLISSVLASYLFTLFFYGQFKRIFQFFKFKLKHSYPHSVSQIGRCLVDFYIPNAVLQKFFYFSLNLFVKSLQRFGVSAVYVYGRIFTLFYYIAFSLFSFFIYTYYELRYVSIFALEYLSDFTRFFTLYAKFTTHYDYLGVFKKFFIGSKFFRFFTREIGEDLEETPFNMYDDLESDFVTDYLNGDPAYSDFYQNGDYDDAYSDDEDDSELDGFNTHYFDYWLPSSARAAQEAPMMPNLEFYAQDDFSDENQWLFQIFAIWTNPTLAELSTNATDPLPYEVKDVIDNAAIKPGDWFPNEVSQSEEYEEDHLEYYLESSYDESELSETLSMLPVPFDSDRAKLINFSRTYSRKLATWHSYQVANNFAKLPHVLKFAKVPQHHSPISFSDWKKATLMASEFFLSKSEHRKLAKAPHSLDIAKMSLVWGRVAYEMDKNPKKLYSFLDQKSEEVDVFKNLFFKKDSVRTHNFMVFPKVFMPTEPTFIEFLGDYFSFQVDSAIMTRNSGYQVGSRYDILYAFYLFQFFANRDFQKFYFKITGLSEFSNFKALQENFIKFSKYTNNNFQVVKRDSSNAAQLRSIHSWAGTAYEHQVKSLRPRIRLPRVFDYVHKAWDYFWHYYIRYLKINRWPRKPILTWGWRRQFKFNRTELTYPLSRNIRIGYETFFSLFLEENFFFAKFSSKNKRSRRRLFASYKAAGYYYFADDGDDYDAHVTERQKNNDPLKPKRRTYFSTDQLIEGDIWNSLNPRLDELFYELYYLNSNIFFPTQFSDNLFEEVLPDDETDSGQDIYDDYVYIGGVDDFDRNLGANREEYIVNEDELLDDDPDTLDASDETVWDDYDHYGRLDEGMLHGHETGGEAPDHYSERYWMNSDQWFKLEHIDNDEGLEEWEFDEYEAMYDVDLSLDRFFFGGLKRQNKFPATDQRLFLGPLWEHPLDKDLDYKHNFSKAKKNVDTTALVAVSSPKDFADFREKSYFSFLKFLCLYVYKFIVFFLYYIDYLISGFFSNSTQDAVGAINSLKLYHHYLKWHAEYTSFYNYKSKILDWIAFFEAFETPKVFKNYKFLRSTFLVHETQTFDYLSHTYGRFWLQYPFNNYLNEFAQYNDANILYTDPFYYDCLVKVKDKRVHLFPEDLDKYYSDYMLAPITGGFDEAIDKKNFNNAYRFFANDPLYSRSTINHFRKKRLSKLTSYPWFLEGSRDETLGSDFIYLDLNFIDDMPEDDEFFDYHRKDFAYGLLPTYNQHTDFFFKWIEQRRSGAAVSPHLPNDGTLDGYAFEETDWDIGTLASYSTDEFNSHLDEFTEKFDIFVNAATDFFDLLVDYSTYFFYSKTRIFVLAPFRYWESQSNSRWLLLASRYGIWVLLFRNFVNFSIFIALFVYGFFVLTRLFYFACGEAFSYGFYNFLLFFASFFFIVILARLVFKPFNDFYKSIDFGERFEILFFILFAWYFYNLNGYVRAGHVIWTEENGADALPLLTNNFSSDFRDGGGDYTMQTGFTHRPELNNQAWLFRKATIAPRIYKNQYHPGYEKIPPDRQYWWYNFGVASYPTYFNPYNFFSFVKFHLFHITNENFVGYKDFKRYKFEPSSLQIIENSHTIYHRPQMLNWMHMHTRETRVWIKDQIMEHAYTYLATTNPHLYVNLTSDRLKYNNIVFTNPVNPRPYATTPHTFYSADRPSRLPYDFRPKVVSESYSYGENFKFNSGVYNNNKYLSNYNSLQSQPNRNSFLFYPDKSTYTLEDSEDRRIVNLKNLKYKRQAYKSFRARNYFSRLNKYNLYENTSNVRWSQGKLFSNNFSFDYATNFRKYMFYFNPHRAQSLQDVYGFSIRDVTPYPELLLGDKQRVPNLFFSEIFRKLSRKERTLFRSLVELENETSSRTAFFHSLEFSNFRFPQYFLYTSYNATPPYQLSTTFYKDYIVIFKKLSIRLKRTVTPTSPEVVPPAYLWVLPRAQYDKLKRDFNLSITSLKFDKVETTAALFKNILNVNSNPPKSNHLSVLAEKVKSVKYKKRSVTKFDYISKIAYSNRLRRARLANAYFRSAKAASKFSTQDFFRDYAAYLDPHAVTRHSYNSSFAGFVSGFPEKRETLGKRAYDSYNRRKNPNISIYSAKDDRASLIGFNKDLVNFAAYEAERRQFVDTKRSKSLDALRTKYFEKHVSNFAWWDYFLEFTRINRLFSQGYSNVVQPYIFPHKYIKYFYTTNRRARINYYSDGSILNYNFDTNILRSTSWLRSYNNEQKRINKRFSRSYGIVFEDDETVEHLLRYSYADHISGVERPPIVGNRLNLRKPHLFARLRRNHWYDLHTVPNQYERHKKPFFGMTIINEDFALHGGKKFTFEFKNNSFTSNHHVIKGYMWANFLQRVKLQYPKKFKRASIPANQKFLELFRISAKDIEGFFSDYEAPIDSRTWEKQLSGRFALPIPYDFSKPENFPIIFKRGANRFGDMVERDHKLFEQIKQRAIVKNKVKAIKTILENKQKVARFHKHVKKTSAYFRKLRERAGYDTRGQSQIVNKRDMRRYRELIFMGIDRADEEKGEADIILYRAKKCLAAKRAKREKFLKKRKQ
jgi:hypothetical protein